MHLRPYIFSHSKYFLKKNIFLCRNSLLGINPFRYAHVASLKFNKDLSQEFPRAYKPTLVEEGWYEWWQKSGIFKMGEQAPERTSADIFTMVIPPPNITGDLHLGHALTVAIQDTLLRWHRMKGKQVLWVPGCDHAGIATQTKLEQFLQQNTGMTRLQLGKERFLAEAHQWKTAKMETIYKQLQELGAMLDFDRAVFTMDEHMSNAVKHAFISLFDQGLIYRENHMVKWCPQLQSVISDIEVNWLTLDGPTKITLPSYPEPVLFGVMDYFAYPLADSAGELVTATTRVESMVGDQALCVHPKDPRYRHLIGKEVIHPFTGARLPIIADECVDRELGTGVLKVTPSHDPLDFTLAKKYQLPLCELFDDHGFMQRELPVVGGLNRFEAKDATIKALQQKELYRGQKDHPTKIPLCSRTGDLLESRLTPQWFLKTEQMARQALEVVENGQLSLIPPGSKGVWYEFLKKETRDWCISRQLWWGHDIPVYTVKIDGGKEFFVAASTEEEAQEKVFKKYKLQPGSYTLTKDKDVLDTWFSSALFPFTALGWPGKLDLRAYPLSIMETGHDILFFWVAKMVMMGIHFTKQLPFPEVLLHGLLLDGQKRKMSKSLGNAFDPLQVIHGASLQQLQSFMPEGKDELAKNFPEGLPECGADGLRFALLLHDIKSRNICLDLQSVKSSKHFGNKIWQGCRFTLLFMERHPDLETSSRVANLVDAWILSRMAQLIDKCNKDFASYDFHFVTISLRRFWVQEFCDFYLESLKFIESSDPSQKEKIASAVHTLQTVILTYLRLLAPIMPFLCEELYLRLTQIHGWHLPLDSSPASSIFLSGYPQPEKWENYHDQLLEEDIGFIRKIIFQARSLKQLFGIGKCTPKAFVHLKSPQELHRLEGLAPLVCCLAKIDSLTFSTSPLHNLTFDNSAFEDVTEDGTLYLKLEGLVTDPRQTTTSHLQKEYDKLTKLMGQKNYCMLAPKEVQCADAKRIKVLEGRLAALASH